MHMYPHNSKPNQNKPNKETKKTEQTSRLCRSRRNSLRRLTHGLHDPFRNGQTHYDHTTRYLSLSVKCWATWLDAQSYFRMLDHRRMWGHLLEAGQYWEMLSYIIGWLPHNACATKDTVGRSRLAVHIVGHWVLSWVRTQMPSSPRPRGWGGTP